MRNMICVRVCFILLVCSRGGNKLSEALPRLANAPGVSIRQLAKALANY